MNTILSFLLKGVGVKRNGTRPRKDDTLIIQTSNVRQNAGHIYRSSSSTAFTQSVWDNTTGSHSSVSTASSQNPNSFQFSLKEQLQNYMKDFQATHKTGALSLSEKLNDIQRLQQETLNHLLDILFGRKYKPLNSEMTNPETNTVTENQFQGQGSSQTISYFYEEHELTHFESTGTAVTADGRSISFNVSLTMSRSFMEATNTYVEKGEPYLCDPLVINLKGNCASVSDQKFFFDLDADGTPEEMSQLASGSGYLALDKNENGIIDDGNELFGTKSGNGFADLAEYDLDHNGWIDEADAIWNKLRIWSIDSSGQSTLISLKDAGVGAIYLASEDTNFSLTDDNNNVNAMIRRTGIFLYEEGAVGSIQQMDLAI